MKEVVIEVNNLTKRFRLHKKQRSSLKETLSYSFRNRRKNIDDFCALDNISFKVSEGEALGIIGKNGAGKSTLLRILRDRKSTRLNSSH